MAIQPIDLQTLFSQVDKVGKNQALQKEGLQLHAHMQGIQQQQKNQEQVQSVNETQNTGEGIEKVKDDGGQKNPRQGEQAPEEEAGETAEADEKRSNGTQRNSAFRDPALGRNVDISG
jgi:hypothetical protein